MTMVSTSSDRSAISSRPAVGTVRSRVKGLWRGVALALRPHRRRPLLSLVIVLSLVLGLGVNTAVLSLIDAIFVRPLPVSGLDRLVAVYRTDRSESGQYTGRGRFSYPTYADLRERNRTFEHMGIYTWRPVNFAGDGVEPLRAIAMFSDAGYFQALGVTPALGRFFRPSETEAHSPARVAVLSHATWVRRFGSSPAVLGRTVRIDSIPFEVVGVGPRGFQGTQLHVGVDVWVPAQSYREMGAMGDSFDRREVAIFSIIGRLAPGASLTGAQSDLMGLSRQIEGEYPSAEEGLGTAVEPLLDGVLLPRERPSYVGYARVVSLAAGLVLLVSCLNVAVLLLLRGLDRRRDLAVRQVLGADRPRLVRQLVGENLVLFAAGGLLAIPASAWTQSLLWKFRPPRLTEGLLDAGLEDQRLLWGLALLAVTTILVGILPAWRSARLDPGRQIRTGDQGPGGRRFRSGDLLVTCQVGLAVVALVGGGLFVQHLSQARDIDLGFAADHLAVMTAAPGDEGYDTSQVRAFYDDLETRVRALPGVEAATWSENRLLRGAVIQHEIFVAGSQEPVSGAGRLVHRTDAVRPGFFATVGIPLLQGRDFDSSDRADSPKVAIINQTMAKLLWPGQNPIGQHFRFDYLKNPEVEVVGVARDAKYRYIHEGPQFFIYVPFAQVLPASATLHVRTAGDPRQILTALRAQTHELDPAMPVADLAPLGEFVEDELWLERAAASFLSVMAFLSLVLVAIGIHGVMAFSVQRRTREFGVRLSLGATRWQVVRHVLATAGARVVAGILLGVVGVVAILRPAAASFLGAIDPWFTTALALGAAALVAVVALGGIVRLARGSARETPSVLLRER